MCGLMGDKFGSVYISDKKGKDGQISPLNRPLKCHMPMELMLMVLGMVRHGQRGGHIKMRGSPKPWKLGPVDVP